MFVLFTNLKFSLYLKDKVFEQKRKLLKNVLVQGPGYTKKTSRSSSSYPTLIKNLMI